MKIKSIRIENFRSFQDETITLNAYSCFVGPNGAGKSNVLSALNVFFQEKTSSSTDTTKLTDEDYFGKNTDKTVRITIIFGDLSTKAQADLSHYVRQGQLVVTAEAEFDPNTGRGQVLYYGQRSAMPQFAGFFDASKRGEKAPQLTEIFAELRERFPGIENARSKDDREKAL